MNNPEKMTVRKFIVLFFLLVALGLAPVQPAGAAYMSPTPIVYVLPASRSRRRIRRTALHRLGIV